MSQVNFDDLTKLFICKELKEMEFLDLFCLYVEARTGNSNVYYLIPDQLISEAEIIGWRLERYIGPLSSH